MRALNTASGQLARAIQAALPGCTVTFERLDAHAWASGIFSGMRHDILCRVEGERATRLCRDFTIDLAEREFALRGHIVADIELKRINVLDGQVHLSIEALTVEE